MRSDSPRTVHLSVLDTKSECRRTDAFLVAVGKNAAAPIPVGSGLVGPVDGPRFGGHLGSSLRLHPPSDNSDADPPRVDCEFRVDVRPHMLCIYCIMRSDTDYNLIFI